jgi:hypothetical protein
MSRQNQRVKQDASSALRLDDGLTLAIAIGCLQPRYDITKETSPTPPQGPAPLFVHSVPVGEEQQNASLDIHSFQTRYHNH